MLNILWKHYLVKTNIIEIQTSFCCSTVGHIPKEFSNCCTAFLLSGGRINCVVTGKHENKRRNGLEVPCIYRINSPNFKVQNEELLINEHLEKN